MPPRGIPKYILPEETQPICIHCGSTVVKIYEDFILTGGDMVQCLKCGKAFPWNVP